MTTKKIIVGYDGSAPARRAARWALDEATRTGAPVELCSAPAFPAPVAPPALPPHPAPGTAGDTAGDLAASAAVSHPSVAVRTVVSHEPAADTLIARSADASLIVLGKGDRPAATGRIGCVAVGVAAEAQCSVIVVRGQPAPWYPIVVGVDHSGAALHALAFAFEQAAARAVPLLVMRAWLPPAGGHHPDALPAVLAEQRRNLIEQLDGWQEKFPSVDAMHSVLVDHPARALADASRDAQLVVVGTRSHAFRGTLLGSVSRHLVQRAASSVAVVRDGNLRTACAGDGPPVL